MSVVDIIGYVASLLILFSISVKNVKHFRWINFAGGFIFAIYGALIDAYPILAVNGIIAIIDLYYLKKIYSKKDYFDINEELQGNEFFIKRFFEFYKNEINKFFPNFSFEKISNPKLILVSRNIVPVGLFVYEKDHDSRSIIIHLDFACPDYRDTKNFFYILQSKIFDFKNEGYERYVTESTSESHIAYLERVGFRKSVSGDRFELPL